MQSEAESTTFGGDLEKTGRRLVTTTVGRRPADPKEPA